MANFSIACLFLYLIAFSWADDRPSISETIIQETKRVGETAILNCTVINQGSYQVIWKRKDNDRTLTTNTGVDSHVRHKYGITFKQLPTGGRRYSLHVYNLERVDEGVYICTVNVDGSDNDPSMAGNLVINLKPSIILAKSSQPTVYAQIGQNFTLKCEAEGVPAPTIYFKRVKGALPDGNITYQGNSVTFTNISKSARGVYQCHADNHVDEGDTFLITVKIGFPPETKPVQTSYGQKRDKPVLLECRVVGEPEPDLRWFQQKNNERIPISDNQKYEIAKPPNYNPMYDISELFYTVTFEVSADDYGDYICQATNKYGTAESKVSVFEAYDLCQGGFCLSLRGDETAGGACLQSAFLTTFTAVSMVLCNIWS